MTILMQRPLKIILSLVCIASVLLAAFYIVSVLLKEFRPDSAQQSWTEFRGAVLKNDLNAVADMTEFPLTLIRLEDAKEKLLSRQEFIKHLPQLLNAPVGDIYPPIAPVPATMQELAQVAMKPGGSVLSEAPETLYIGHWTFHLRSDGWRLAVVYVPAFPSSMDSIPIQP